MKILLIGKTGQLGGSILTVAKGHDILAPERHEADITDIASIERCINLFQPDVLINTAAFHNVPLCEEKPLHAFDINCVAVKNLANLCRQKNILLVTFSSDYVFDGFQQTPFREEAPTRPLQIYGISRLAGELAAMACAPEHTLIVRTCGLYASSVAQSKGGNFVENRLRDAETINVIDMACEQIVTPTAALDLAVAVMQLLEHPQCGRGIYHLTCEGECSWAEFTQAIYEIAGLPTRVNPVNRNGLSGEMRRPKYSVLANTRAKSLGIELPHWKKSLQDYILGSRSLDNVK